MSNQNIIGMKGLSRSNNNSKGTGFMLFGVRVMEATVATGNNSFRKSASMNNLSLFDSDHHHDDHQHHFQDDSNVVVAGYASDDVVHPSARSRERKRGVPWSEEEHRQFLVGLQKVGKGDWRGISRNFVKTRTPTQVASHAQKYFLRRNNTNRRRRRSSLFDITTHTAPAKLEDQQINQNTNLEKYPFQGTFEPVKLPVNVESATENLTIGLMKKPIRPIPVPPSSKMANLNLNNTYIQDSSSSPLSLKLSTSMSSEDDEKSPAGTRHSSTNFQAMSSGFNGNSNSGDNIISVA